MEVLGDRNLLVRDAVRNFLVSKKGVRVESDGCATQVVEIAFA